MLIHSAGIPSKKELALKKQLNNLISKYGELDPRVLRKSMQLDVVVVKRQRALMNA